jgi:hypothetical protein
MLSAGIARRTVIPTLYDSRLRSKPYLKAEERPEIITTREGKEIPVNKVKAGDHEKIMK